MKSRNLFLIALALQTIPSVALAQEQIKKQFEKIDNYKGITRISESKGWTTDSLGLTTGSRVVILRAGEEYFGDFDKLKDAFDNDGSRASMCYSYIADHFTDGENSVPRKQWSVTREGADPVIVGAMKNSTYLIATFDDAEHPGYRRCYAAEWSEMDAPDPRQLQLTYVYGRKPTPQTTISRTIRYSATPDWPELGKSLLDLHISPDSLQKFQEEWRITTDSLVGMPLEQLHKYFPNSRPQDIPMKDGDTKEWMRQAMNRVKHLSASDWHRFFGIMTQNMIERAKRQSTEDMVVAANLVLDLCKNADQLDDDERALAARRLQQMNASGIIEDAYVRDLLQLGYKKLLRK